MVVVVVCSIARMWRPEHRMGSKSSFLSPLGLQDPPQAVRLDGRGFYKWQVEPSCVYKGHVFWRRRKDPDRAYNASSTWSLESVHHISSLCSVCTLLHVLPMIHNKLLKLRECRQSCLLFSRKFSGAVALASIPYSWLCTLFHFNDRDWDFFCCRRSYSQ